MSYCPQIQMIDHLPYIVLKKVKEGFSQLIVFDYITYFEDCS